MAHDVITTKLTWSKEVSRVVYRRCTGCHRPEGRAFSLVQYEEARPWAKAIQEEVLRRTMPPSNAILGFGQLRHDLGLSEEEIHIIADWVEGGAPEGDANLLPGGFTKSVPEVALKGTRVPFRGSWKATARQALTGVEMGRMSEGQTFKLVREAADGSRQPLLWIERYSPKAVQRYEFAAPVVLAPGDRVVAYPATGVDVRLVTRPATAKPPAR